MNSYPMNPANLVSMDSFIAEVEKHPAIWDYTSDVYSNKTVKDAAWDSIIETFFEDFDERPTQEKTEITEGMQKKWRNLRTCFTREMNKRKMDISNGIMTGRRRKPYLYFEQLRFLEPFTRVGCSLNDQEEVEDSEETPLKQEQVQAVNKPFNLEEQRPKKIPRFQRAEVEVAEQSPSSKSKPPSEPLPSTSEEEDDRLFLLSLVSELKRVPIDQKIKVKTDILLAISNCQQF